MCYVVVGQAIDWVAATSADEIIAFREEVVSKLEVADMKMRANGTADAWFFGSDAQVEAIARQCNGCLFQFLLLSTGYDDVQCVELLRQGAPVLNLLLACLGHSDE